MMMTTLFLTTAITATITIIITTTTTIITTIVTLTNRPVWIRSELAELFTFHRWAGKKESNLRAKVARLAANQIILITNLKPPTSNTNQENPPPTGGDIKTGGNTITKTNTIANTP